MTTTTEKRELVWLPEDLAKKVKDISDTKEIENEILKYVSDSKLSLRQDIANIDDEILVYKASMVKARQAFKSAMDEQFNEWEKLWTEKSELYDLVQGKARQLKEEVSPLKTELENIRKEMQSISTWSLNDLLKTVDTISSHLSQNGETGKVLRFLFENYKSQ